MLKVDETLIQLVGDNMDGWLFTYLVDWLRFEPASMQVGKANERVSESMLTLQSKRDREGREPIINLRGIPFMFTSGW